MNRRSSFGRALAVLLASAASACGDAPRSGSPSTGSGPCDGAGASVWRPAGFDLLAYAQEFDTPEFPAELSRVGGLGFAAPYDPVEELQRFVPERARVVRGPFGTGGAEIGALALEASWDVARNEYLAAEVVSSASHCPVQQSDVPGPCEGTLWGSGVRFAPTRTQGVFVEVCAKLPLTPGNWPAIWILRDEGPGFPAPELDLIEAFPLRDRAWCQTEHVLGASHEECTTLDPGAFHAFGALIDPAGKRIDFFIDGRRSYAPGAMPDHSAAWADETGDGHPAYLVLTHALSTVIGGAFAAPAGSAVTLVDHVRIYTNGPESVLR